MSKTTRDDIIHLAREMFRDQGYAGFSMGSLADRAGIRKASLYSRFSGKDELAHEALALTLAELRALSAVGADAQSRFRSLLELVAAYLADARRCIGLHLTYGGDPETAQQVRDFFGALRDMCADTLSDALPPDQARALAEDSLAALEGATLWLVLNGDEAPLRRAIETAMIAFSALSANAPAASPPDPATARVLARYPEGERAGSVAETRLAADLAALEDDLLTVRAALAGQIAAESCFL